MARGHSADFGTFGISLQDFVMFAVASHHKCLCGVDRSSLVSSPRHRRYQSTG